MSLFLLNDPQELAQYECVIERGLNTFIEVGEALLHIRDKRLYEDDTFEAYCRRRWGFTRRHADRLIQSAEVVSDLRPIGLIPDTEGQVRPLTRLKTPAARQEAWASAVADAGEKPVTAAHVERAVQMVNTFFEEQPQYQFGQTVPLIATKETPSTPGFNRTNDNVEWALWTWNPVTGCLHDCPYCYARDIANRFYPQKFVPTFHTDRIHAPRHMKVPDAAIANMGEQNVFVCSMADLWGKWVPSEWIDQILEEVRNAPQWNFLFLTKFPARYEEYAGRLPANAWMGTSVDRQHAVDRAEKAFRRLKEAGYEGISWLSCEPMLERLTFSSLSMFDWVVMGGASKSTQTPEFRPPFLWTADLYMQAKTAGCSVYMKTNLLPENPRVREYPWTEE